ncbi:MAG: cell filamentation protein Fic [Deltaproteobacteria bacterium RIFCSPLOWO2_02_FULL_44_10]|nr:MAG: cell filamentation protein Fic [Deltaproteobacteria bacterium RIFCSPHIGHO2_02_FULL_44_16]OGQ47583.1 MAG: cell filamentation protein Fic [Deltaproteobacteria bacterium RIFCSPLOWO2_02_FULL_44_10]
MKYNWQLPDWPHLRYQLPDIQELLFTFAEKTGTVSGLLRGLPENMQQETLIDFMLDEAIKTSEIEGEYLRRADVVSSLRNQLGLNPSPEKVSDKRAEGIAELLIAVRQSFSKPLTQATLFHWHRMLMQGHRHEKLIIGGWRKDPEPMQVVSGSVGKWKVHFEAPPAKNVPHEMERFIHWFNEADQVGPVRAAITHLYFESIHPFDDGNGRIGRALAEKALSQGLGRPILLSFSKTIEAHKKDYYAALEKAQRSNEITEWIFYFVNTIILAQEDAEKTIEFVFHKAEYFDRYKDQLSERQLKVIRRMLKEGPSGFEGGMTARKYASLTKISKATATRDLQHLEKIGALLATGSGRSTRYEINL